MSKKAPRLLIRIVLVTLLVACSLQPVEYGPVSTVTPTLSSLTNQSLVSPTITSKPTETKAATDTTTQQPTSTEVGIIMPAVEPRCPPQTEVQLDRLGLSIDTRLLLRLDSAEWVLVSSDLSQKTVHHQPSTEFAGVNPNQQWFAYYADTSFGPNSSLWISSMDGKLQSKVVENTNGSSPVLYEWLNNTAMIGFTGKLGQRIATLRLDPFALDTQPLDNISVTSGTTSYAFSPDAWQVIYNDFPVSWALYDFRSGTRRPILQGLMTDSENPPSPIVQWTDTGVSAVVVDANGLGLVQHLLPSQLDQPIPPLTPVMLPHQDESSAQIFKWWSSDSQLLAVTLVFGGKDRYDTTDKPSEFFILDTTNWVAYSYCLPSDLAPTHVYASLDERFIAWNAISKGSLLGTVVLELATGKRTLIPNGYLLGWGQVVETPTPTP